LLIPYILALLLSLGAATLASIFGWSPASLRLLLVALALLCDLQLFWLMIGKVRDLWMAFDYAPVQRRMSAPLPHWWRAGYRYALAITLISGLFGALLGGGIGWWLLGAALASDLALPLALAYALPLLLGTPYFARRWVEAQQFAAERSPQHQGN
jgi:hypothetical protein